MIFRRIPQWNGSAFGPELDGAGRMDGGGEAEDADGDSLISDDAGEMRCLPFWYGTETPKVEEDACLTNGWPEDVRMLLYDLSARKEVFGESFAKPFRSGMLEVCENDRKDDVCEGTPEMERNRDTSGFIAGRLGRLF